MDRAAVQSELKNIVLDILEDEEIHDFKPQDDFIDDLDMDSLQAVSMLVHIEKKFKIALPQSHLEKFRTLDAVTDLVLENLSA